MLPTIYEATEGLYFFLQISMNVQHQHMTVDRVNYVLIVWVVTYVSVPVGM